ncbi:MAG: radical SAM protein [bacterium]
MSSKINEPIPSPDDLPSLVVADIEGRIFDHHAMGMAGMSGRTPCLPQPDELVPLPFGSTLFYMPGRAPLGWDREKNRIGPCTEATTKGRTGMCFAVAAFLPPGYVRTLLPAARLLEDAPTLPLWAYAAVGWKEGKFWATGIQVDPNPHWDPVFFQDDEGLAGLVREALSRMPGNRLLSHLARCALEYHCFAAKNCFYRRWELPLPTSPGCNARCLGCISLQPAGCCPAPHGRISFVPTVEEICDITLPHLTEAEDPIASFGQGCEGEPILQAGVIERAVKRLRTHTSRGIINLNTNGSKPDVIDRLCRAGMDSIRVSLNSPHPPFFTAYHRPMGFSLQEVKESLILAREAGASSAINLLVFPGVTDREEERDRLVRFIWETGIDQIQMRNLNIDPDIYCAAVTTEGPRYPLPSLMADLQEVFPNLTFGYFNRAKRE